MPIPVSAINALAATATKLAGELGNLIPNVAPPVSPLNSEASAAVVQSDNAVVSHPENAVVSPPDVVSPVVQSNAAITSGADAVVSHPANDVEPDQPNAVVQNDAAGTPSASEPVVAASEPGSAATAAAPSVLDGLSIPYGSGLSVPYASIARMIQNMINDPKFNKKNISNDTLQSLLTKIKLATTPLEVTNLLNGAGFGKMVGTKLAARYFSGGTKKRKRTKMTKRRKTRKMKKTRKMRKMRKTMKI